jgi:acetyl-CoA carboxylase carboxyltransferase component
LIFLNSNHSELKCDINIQADEVRTGTGIISGRKVAYYAHDPKINQGFVSSKGAQKICQLMDYAFDNNIPIVSLLCSPGVSVQEGIESGIHYTNVINKNILYSGKVPQIAVVMGMTMGAPAYSATLMDFVLFNKSRSTLMVTGPTVIKEVMGEDTGPKELGGAKLHSEVTGIVDTVDKNITQQLLTLKRLIEILPSSSKHSPPKRFSFMPRQSAPIIPKDAKSPFDMMLAINAIVDCSEIFEIKSNYGKSIITGFSYIDGKLIGILANQSLELSGAINCNASRKASRFLRLCNSYNIPILNLIDVPGFMPGKEQESMGLLRYGAQLCMGLQTSIARMSIVVRRAYGAAAYILIQSKNKGGSLSVALENSKIAIMGYEAAEKMVYKESNEDNSKSYYKEYEDPKLSLDAGLIDEIVKFSQVRDVVSKTLNSNNNKISTFKERIFP